MKPRPFLALPRPLRALGSSAQVSPKIPGLLQGPQGFLPTGPLFSSQGPTCSPCRSPLRSWRSTHPSATPPIRPHTSSTQKAFTEPGLVLRERKRMFDFSHGYR